MDHFLSSLEAVLVARFLLINRTLRPDLRNGELLYTDVLHPHGQHTRCSHCRAVLQKELSCISLHRQGVLRVGDAMA